MRTYPFDVEPLDDVVKSLRGNEGWHHDSTYMPLQAKGSVFAAEVVTSRGGRPSRHGACGCV